MMRRRDNQTEQCRSRSISLKNPLACLGTAGLEGEGRFKSQALLDEAGLLTAMAYVDLNPVRAGIAATPEESEFTSIYARLRQLQQEPPVQARTRQQLRGQADRPAPPPLLAFSESADPDRSNIPMKFLDYLQLVDWSGRRYRPGKHGVMKQNLPPILARLQIDPDEWLRTMGPGGNRFGRAIGRFERLQSHARRLGQCWIRGLQAARRLQQA